LVHTVRLADVLAKQKERSVIDNRLPATAVGIRVARASHHRRRLITPIETGGHSSQLLPLRRLDHVVRVEAECKIARGPLERDIARRGEVIDSGIIEDPRPELRGDLLRPIRAPGIRDADLVEDPSHGAQGRGQVNLFIPCDHGQRGPGPLDCKFLNHRWNTGKLLGKTISVSATNFPWQA
jgi:hypothetical protein